MISDKDIEAWKAQGWGPKEVEKAILRKAEDLAYEFNTDYMYELLKLTKEFGEFITNEQLMDITHKAYRLWYDEHN